MRSCYYRVVKRTGDEWEGSCGMVADDLLMISYLLYLEYNFLQL